MRYLLLPFILFENFLLLFCKQPEPSQSGGGRKDGMTDEQRNEEGNHDIPTLREVLRG